MFSQKTQILIFQAFYDARSLKVHNDQHDGVNQHKWWFSVTIFDSNGALLQILLGRGIHIDFSSQLKFAKIGYYGAFHL